MVLDAESTRVTMSPSAPLKPCRPGPESGHVSHSPCGPRWKRELQPGSARASPLQESHSDRSSGSRRIRVLTELARKHDSWAS